MTIFIFILVKKKILRKLNEKRKNLSSIAHKNLTKDVESTKIAKKYAEKFEKIIFILRNY